MEEFKNINSLKEKIELALGNRTSEIKVLSEYILEHLKATKHEKSKSTKEILQCYSLLKDNFSEIIPDIPENSFAVFLSRISSEQNSQINCLGRKQGYYLEQLVEKIEKIEKIEQFDEKCITDNTALKNDQQFREKDIYPKIKQWMFEKNYERVGDTSTLRTNGKWGNPDIVGLKIRDFYGCPNIEITSIEVKLTNDSWEEWIFEAVSHTRFSNRSYYAFLYPENLYNKLDSTELKLYAEHFRVGILVIEINGDDYLKLKSKQPVDLDFEKINIVEYYPAPYNETNDAFRKKFLQALDILDLNKLYRFGEELN